MPNGFFTQKYRTHNLIYQYRVVLRYTPQEHSHLTGRVKSITDILHYQQHDAINLIYALPTHVERTCHVTDLLVDVLIHYCSAIAGIGLVSSWIEAMKG